MSTIDTINKALAGDDGVMSEKPVIQQEEVSVTPAGSPDGKIEQNGQDGASHTMSYVEMMQQLSPYKPPTDEELERVRKKQKRDAVFAAIGDGLSAFHNAYSHARGVQPMANLGGYSQKVRDRYERMKKERDEQAMQYANAYIKAEQADRESSRNSVLDALKAKNQDRLEEETRIRREKADAYMAAQAAREEKDEAQAAYWQTKAYALEQGIPLDEAVKRAEAAKKRAEARLKNVQADGGGYAPRSGVGGYTTTEEKTTTDRHGRTSTSTTTKTRVPNGESGQMKKTMKKINW